MPWIQGGLGVRRVTRTQDRLRPGWTLLELPEGVTAAFSLSVTPERSTHEGRGEDSSRGVLPADQRRGTVTFGAEKAERGAAWFALCWARDWWKEGVGEPERSAVGRRGTTGEARLEWSERRGG
eukprot:668606-Rhodomonas_salina.2